MGVVYEAWKEGAEAPVALKVLVQGMPHADLVRRRFEREWRVSSALSHPHLVSPLDFGEADGQLYMTLELLSGGDAEDRVRLAGGGLAEAEVVAAARDIAGALTALHAKGFIHRDLKPGNLMYSTQGAVKLGDFGCAREKNVSEPITTDGMILGTPDYMSPEQARGESDIDQRTDIYSLGATLYYLATARTPFDGTTAWGIIGQVINHPFPDPRRHRPNLSEGFAGLILTACAKDRTERYPDAEAFAADCRSLLEGRATSSTGRARQVDEFEVRGPAPGQRQSVLLIDDDPIISRIYLQRLRQDGFDVGISATGAGALHTLAVTAYDCVLLDLGLPDMDGIEVLKVLRGPDRPRPSTEGDDERIPVIALSNAFNLEKMSAATAAGADAILAKSRVSPREVSAAVREVIAHGRLGVARESAVMADDVSSVQLMRHANVPLQRLAVAVDNMGSNGWPCIYALEIQSTCRGMSALAAAAGARAAAAISAAAEMLVRHLLRRPGDFQESTRRTLKEAIAAIRAQLQATEPGRDTAKAALRALVVDDDPMITRLASTALKLLGMAVTAVNSPEEALRIAAGSAFDVCILDINMPELSGRDLAKRLRLDGKHGSVPIVFITALSEVERAIDDVPGPVDLIAKPFPIMELATKVLSLLAAPPIEGPA